RSGGASWRGEALNLNPTSAVGFSIGFGGILTLRANGAYFTTPPRGTGVFCPGKRDAGRFSSVVTGGGDTTSIVFASTLPLGSPRQTRMLNSTGLLFGLSGPAPTRAAAVVRTRDSMAFIPFVATPLPPAADTPARSPSLLPSPPDPRMPAPS